MGTTFKKTYDIKGMHCRSCEVLIEDGLRKIDGIKKVHASTKDKSVTVKSLREIDDQEIQAVIEKLGYEFGEDNLPLISQNSNDYKDLFSAAIFLIAIILVGKSLGLQNFLSFGTKTDSNLFVVLTVGLTAGFSTCMALVGGLILGVSARFAEKHPTNTAFQKFKPHLYFNLGRVISYFLLGGLIGTAGSILKISGNFLGMITIVVGMVMLYLGLQLTELFPGLISKVTLPKKLTEILKINSKKEKEYSNLNSMILGGLTFFLPCGFTQAMQVYAISTGNFLSGALIMGVFALGTMPGLLGIGGLTSIIKEGYFSKLFYKFVALILIVLAFTNISNGLTLAGFKFSLPKVTANSVSSTVQGGEQVVNMDQDESGYHPNSFTVKRGVPVKWVINSKSQFTCSASILMRDFRINEVLKPGENIINFTPQQAGQIVFTCSMGMYRGTFNVTN